MSPANKNHKQFGFVPFLDPFLSFSNVNEGCNYNQERKSGWFFSFWVDEGEEAGTKELRLERERLSVFKIIGDKRINEWVVGLILALLLMG
jgi:hypothetical protein